MYMKSGGAPPLHPTALHTPAPGKVRCVLVADPPQPGGGTQDKAGDLGGGSPRDFVFQVP